MNKFLNRKWILIILLSTTALMTGCSEAPTRTPGNIVMSDVTPCRGNPYLMRYDCSLDRMQIAAEGGDPDAQYALGYMYYYGINTVRDPQTAKLWIRRAAMQGQPLAKKAVKMMEGNIYSGPAGHVTPPPKYYEPPVKANGSQLNQTRPLNHYLPGYGASENQKKTPVIDSLRRSETSPINNEPMNNGNNSKPDKITVPAVNGSMNSSMNSSIKNNELLAANSQYYTLQLMGSHDLQAVNAFIRRYHLSDNSKIYTTRYHNEQWYMLVYGHYNSVIAAHSALHNLPRGIRALHPWVKSFATVQKEIRLQKIIS